MAVRVRRRPSVGVAGPGAVQARIAAVRAGPRRRRRRNRRARTPAPARRAIDVAPARAADHGEPAEIDHAGRVKKRRVRLAVAGAELAVAVVAPAAHVVRVEDSARVRAPGGDAAQRAPAALRRLGQEVPDLVRAVAVGRRAQAARRAAWRGCRPSTSPAPCRAARRRTRRRPRARAALRPEPSATAAAGGAVRAAASPRPSWPASLAPQHLTAPPSRSTQVVSPAGRDGARAPEPVVDDRGPRPVLRVAEAELAAGRWRPSTRSCRSRAARRRGARRPRARSPSRRTRSRPRAPRGSPSRRCRAGRARRRPSRPPGRSRAARRRSRRRPRRTSPRPGARPPAPGGPARRLRCLARAGPRRPRPSTGPRRRPVTAQVCAAPAATAIAGPPSIDRDEGVAHLAGPVAAVGEVAEAELAVGVAPPALERAPLQDRARMIVARRERAHRAGRAAEDRGRARGDRRRRRDRAGRAGCCPST